MRTNYFKYASTAAMAVALITQNAAFAQQNHANGPLAAVALEQRADGWRSMPEKWSKLAGALERAAGIRGADDPQAVKDLFLAAAARVRVGDAQRAQSLFVRAADWALAMGDVDAAANGYLRGALVAVELKDVAAAQELRGKAERLARSPLLTEGQRAAILGHFVDAGSDD